MRKRIQNAGCIITMAAARIRHIVKAVEVIFASELSTNINEISVKYMIFKGLHEARCAAFFD